jgi:hypothetical protein
MPKRKAPKKEIKKTAKVKLRKITPMSDKPNSYIVEHELHDVPVPPPLDVPLPEEVLDFDNPDKVPVQKTWAEWWKSLW